jgi:quinol monooxygenase YgiN
VTVLYIVTYIDVQRSSTSVGAALIRQYRDASVTEAGNERVDVLLETSRPNRFVMIEVWKDPSSLESHEKAEHTAQFRTRLSAIHNSPFDRRVHDGFAIGPAPAAARGETLYVVTHVDVPPPRRDETEQLLRGLAGPSRSDEGNARYDVFQQHPPRTNHFTVFAVWKDRDAFDSHEMKDHTRGFREALGPMLGAPYDERLYKPLD